jgi:hypothetical protein
MTAFEHSQAKYVKRAHKIANWREYEAGLRQRGSLTVWISEEALRGWGPPDCRPRKPGGRMQYSNHAIETALTVGTVSHLALRQTDGFLRSLFWLLCVDCSILGHTTISRRPRRLGKLPVGSTVGDGPVRIGPAMRSRTLRGQRVETRVDCQILDAMAALGIRESHRLD